MATGFRCTVVTPAKQVLDEQVVYASIPAWDGQLGVMQRRAPLMVKLGGGVLRLDYAQGGSRWFYLGGGFAQMKRDTLTLLADEVLAAEEVAADQAEAALKEALVFSPRSEADHARRQRDLSRARAMLRLVQEHKSGV